MKRRSFFAVILGFLCFWKKKPEVEGQWRLRSAWAFNPEFRPGPIMNIGPSPTIMLDAGTYRINGETHTFTKQTQVTFDELIQLS